MAKMSINQLVKKHFGEDYEAKLVFTKKNDAISYKQYVVIEDIRGAVLQFTINTESNNIFELHTIEGCTSHYFFNGLSNFIKEVEGR